MLLRIIVLFSSFSVFATSPTLNSILNSALNKNAEIKEMLAELEFAEAQLNRAKALVYPMASALIIAAPIYEETGNASISNANFSKWGPFVKTGVEAIQPIYTFGQISNYKKAAEEGVEASKGFLEMKKGEIVFKTKEFYYGYLMACAFESLLDDLIGYLEEAVKTANKKKKSIAKPHDIYKLKTNLYDLKQKKIVALESRKIAEKAVKWISVSDFENLEKISFLPEKFTMKTLDEYLSIAKTTRPEFKMLKAGQNARLALRDAKKAQSYPAIFVGGYLSYGWSPVRQKQNSFFAYDPFNRLEGGIGIGLKLNLEFLRHSAEAAEETAQYMKLKAKEEYAVPGIELEVKKAFWELEQAIEGLKIAEERKKLSKKWFVSNATGWSLGLTRAKELMESLEGDGLARKNYIETVYAYNISLANLSKAIGKEVAEIK